MAGPDAVSGSSDFFGINPGVSHTNAPGTGTKGVADPSEPASSNYGGADNGLSGTGAPGTTPVNVVNADDGGPATATNPGYYLSSEGTHTSPITGTSGTTNGSPNGKLPAGHTETTTHAGSGSVGHKHA
jgi:hypothetical protein